MPTPAKFLYVYILLCSDNTFYTGVTNNPELRLIQHNNGEDTNAYTYLRRPVQMVYCKMFNDYVLAIEWETRIKKWSKAKKQALIDSNWEELKKHAECNNGTSHKKRMK